MISHNQGQAGPRPLLLSPPLIPNVFLICAAQSAGTTPAPCRAGRTEQEVLEVSHGWPGNDGVSAGGRYEGEGMGAERALGWCSSFAEPMEMMMASWPAVQHPGRPAPKCLCISAGRQMDAGWCLCDAGFWLPAGRQCQVNSPYLSS